MKKMKKIVFSGMQPSGNLTIGNYIGALSQWVNIQEKYNCIYCIADLHAITALKNENIDILKNNIFHTLSFYLACGINPEKSTVFVQSHIPEHTQLSWIINCYTYYSELKRMTQFKNKFNFMKKNINCGVLNYPILMTADILLYQAHLVPVGIDQTQHLELSRNIAFRINKKYKNLFNIPQPMILKFGSKIMSLMEPNKKMSKSDENKNNIISLLENISSIKKKINHAITDSDNPPLIIYDKKNKPGISNLLNILSATSSESIKNLEKRFEGKMYSNLKNETVNYLCEFLIKLQKKYYEYRHNEDYLNKVIQKGAIKARKYAKENLKII